MMQGQESGVPVVASDQGGARETIAPGVTGWLAAPSDPTALAAAIGQALALDEAQRAAFARRARAHVAAGYTRDAMCARTIDVYEELLFPEPAAVQPSLASRERVDAAAAAAGGGSNRKPSPSQRCAMGPSLSRNAGEGLLMKPPFHLLASPPQPPQHA